MTSLNEELSAELRALAARKRLTIATLATLSGLSYASTRRYLAGERSIPLTALVAICEALEVYPGTILDEALSHTKEPS